MLPRALLVTGLAACGAAAAPVYQLSISDGYEVGEDPTISVRAGEARDGSGKLVITRPDGTTVVKPVGLDREQTHVRFRTPVQGGTEPTFTSVGDYRVELRDGEAVLAKQEIRISVDRLTRVLGDDEIAGFEVIARYARARQHKDRRWKTYGAIYEHTIRTGTQIQVVIEEPGEHLKQAWRPYEEEGTLGVIENNHVRFRERTGSVSASWVSGKRIVAMRAASLADVERGFIGHFLARYPSDLGPAAR